MPGDAVSAAGLGGLAMSMSDLHLALAAGNSPRAASWPTGGKLR
jgi:hypothetical protein